MKKQSIMKSLIVANWKCNPSTLDEAKQIFNPVRRSIKNLRKVEVVICPPYTYLSSFRFQASSFKLGAQNCFYENKGAFTGEISPLMLKDIGCQYVIVGHSERRRYFQETDEIVNKKIKAVIQAQMTPILCIGETEKEREGGQAQAVLGKQIELALKKISSRKLRVSGLSIAYEPIWAIGTGEPCGIDTAQTMKLLIRKILSRFYSQRIVQGIRVLYGGSVNSKNAWNFIAEAQMDGLLIGGASLKPQEFLKIIRIVNNH